MIFDAVREIGLTQNNVDIICIFNATHDYKWISWIDIAQVNIRVTVRFMCDMVNDVSIYFKYRTW